MSEEITTKPQTLEIVSVSGRTKYRRNIINLVLFNLFNEMHMF